MENIRDVLKRTPPGDTARPPMMAVGARREAQWPAIECHSYDGRLDANSRWQRRASRLPMLSRPKSPRCGWPNVARVRKPRQNFTAHSRVCTLARVKCKKRKARNKKKLPKRRKKGSLLGLGWDFGGNNSEK